MSHRETDMPDVLPNVGRRELHSRQIQMKGYERDDGLYEVEGRILDCKTYPFQAEGSPPVAPGQPIHHMWVRLVYDVDMRIHEVSAGTDDAPYADCFGASESLQKLRGLVMSGGWSQEIRARLGGANGCTHLTQMLQPMATTAFQTISRVRQSRPAKRDANGRPEKIDSCWSYASDRSIVAIRWPEHATRTRPEV